MNIEVEELTRGGRVTGTVTTISHEGVSMEFKTYCENGAKLLAEIVRRCELYEDMQAQIEIYKQMGE